MESSTDPKNSSVYLARAIEITIRLGVLVFIFGWCFQIIEPFISPILSSMVIAIAIYPIYNSLQLRLKGRRKLSATLITLLFVSTLAIPAWLLADSLIEGIGNLREAYNNGQLTIPPPGDNVKDWPRAAKPIVDVWQLASTNLVAAVAKYPDEVKGAAKFILTLVEKTGLGILQLMIAIIIAGFLLYYSEQGGKNVQKVFVRLGGEQGAHFAELSEQTIRNVVKGILGVAVIQSLLAAIGFVVAGVPFAGVWTLLCLILAVMQIGIGPVILLVIIYMFSTADTLTAVLLMIWLILVGLVDNFLKPIMLGRGAKVPMLVVFLGAIGGFVASGFIGLFLGPVILSIGYKLFQSWLHDVHALD